MSASAPTSRSASTTATSTIPAGPGATITPIPVSFRPTAAPKPRFAIGRLSPKGQATLGAAVLLAVGTVAYLAWSAGRAPAATTDTTPGTNTAVKDPTASAANIPAANTTSTSNAAPAAPVTPPAPRPEPVAFTMGAQPGSGGDGTLVPSPNPNPNPSNPSTNPTTPPPANPPSNNPGTPAGGSPGTSPGFPVNAPNGNPGVVPSSTPGTSPGNTPGTEPQPTSGGGNSVRAMVDEATRAIGAGDLVKGRALLNRALADRASTAQERAALRQQIAALNDTLFFSPTVAKGDPIADTYAIAAGDYLTTIVSKQGLPVEWQLIARINKVNPNALKVGQKIKVIRQPLHAVVSKSGYRMDIYAGDPSPAGGSMGRELGPDGQDTSWTYIRSFNVGLGESNGTPEGSFVIRPRSKMTNPSWVNPRDPKQRFSADDPKNPIGEHWLGLEGTDDVTRKFTGYGIHGTIDPASIGKQMSMGCVRLLGPDIEMVYEMLRDRISTVRIVR